MGVTFEYVSIPLVPASQLLCIEQRVSDQYGPLKTRGDIIALGHPEVTHLPQMSHFEDGCELGNVFVTGYLPVSQDPFPVFEQILTVFERDLQALASLLLTIGFEERESKQRRVSCDSLGIRYASEKLSFLYSALGSKVAKDPIYRRDSLQRLFSAAGLPIILEDKGRDFRLLHQTAGKLTVGLCSPPDLSPAAFECELPEDSTAAALGRMRRALDVLAGTKRFTHRWAIIPLHDPTETCGRNPKARRMYEIVLESGFPATSYQLDLDLILKNISSVDFLASLCGPKDHFVVLFFSFRLPNEEDEYARLSVETSRQGHRLRVETSIPIDIHTLSAGLGVELVKRGHG